MRDRYITVSHSWGKEVKPFTTKATMKQFKKQIKCESLLKTFQDSIYIARKLAISYVWIDSVCIIQDDVEDWRREARTMGLVSEKAYVTISVSTSPGDHAGFIIPHLERNFGLQLRRQDDGNRFSHLY